MRVDITRLVVHDVRERSSVRLVLQGSTDNHLDEAQVTIRCRLGIDCEKAGE